MILTKTPLRVSLFGGGTDLPEFYNYEEGAVLSTAINKFMFIAINKSAHKRIKACYDKIELVSNTNELEHDRIRESFKYFDYEDGLELSSFCEIPTKGTGLGSSSTYTVGIVHALSRLRDKKYNKYEIAEIAYDIERNKCNESLGKQDQYAASFGGLNLIKFSGDNVEVTPVNITSEKISQLEKNLLFFYTNKTRKANDILSKQAKSSVDNIKLLKQLSSYAIMGYNCFIKGDLSDFGSLLHESWEIKKHLTEGISNSIIDEYYDIGRNMGAEGGKLLGAGGGGFLMFYASDKNSRGYIKSAMERHGLKEYNFKLTKCGSSVVYEN